MDAVEIYRDIRDELSVDEHSAAIITLAQVIANKRLTLDDGDCIGHGIWGALDKIFETKTILVSADANVTT